MEEIVNKNNEIVLFNDVCNIIDQTRNTSIQRYALPTGM